MKRIVYIVVLLFALILSACSSDDEHVPEKTSNENPVQADAEPKKLSDDDLKAAKDTVEEGGWIKYRGAEWEGNFDNGGLKLMIHGVSVTNDIKRVSNYTGSDDVEDGIKVVNVWVELQNTTKDKKYNAYPTQATLVTSTGEQVDANPSITEDIGGEIYEGVSKDGSIGFVLEKTTDVANITSVKFVFDAFSEDNTERETFEADIILK
ncbi:hypothetical protein [Bacillus sp. JJ722]|uniref:hypothetical protein n=1 Tax=Bacillus sp. JJ722 TaxID=3122973 RepID=UPI003000C363